MCWYKKYSKIIFLILIAFSSCKHAAKNMTPVTNNVCATPAIISFSQHVLPIFNTHCNISGCHSGNTPAANLNLETSLAYTQLMKRGSGYIDTINPQNSILYTQMISATNPMPRTGVLDNCTIQLILKWIEQKAKNN